MLSGVALKRGEGFDMFEKGGSKAKEVLRFFCLEIEKQEEVGKAGEEDACQRERQDRALCEEGKEEDKGDQFRDAKEEEDHVKEGVPTGDLFKSLQGLEHLCVEEIFKAFCVEGGACVFPVKGVGIGCCHSFIE